jgi:hypothetical protein
VILEELLLFTSIIPRHGLKVTNCGNSYVQGSAALEVLVTNQAAKGGKGSLLKFHLVYA